MNRKPMFLSVRSDEEANEVSLDEYTHLCWSEKQQVHKFKRRMKRVIQDE